MKGKNPIDGWETSPCTSIVLENRKVQEWHNHDINVANILTTVISCLPFFSAELNTYSKSRWQICTIRPLYPAAIERRLLNIVWCTSVDSEKHYYCIAGHFGGLAVLRAIFNISSAKKLHSLMSSLLQIIAFMCTRTVARRTSLIIFMEFTIESCVRGHHFFKEFCTPKIEELAFLSTQGRQSKRHVHSCCKDWHDENNVD